MTLADPLSECYAPEFDESWERTAIASGCSPFVPVRPDVLFERYKRFFACSALNALSKQSGTGYIGLLTAYQTRRRPRELRSRMVGESEIRLDVRTRRVLRTAQPSRVAIDETAVKINGDWSWIYTAIDLGSRLLLDVAVFERRGTDPAAAFLHRLIEKYDLDDTVFLADGYGNLTSLSRLGLSGQLDYVERNLTEKWFYTLKMRIDGFHNSWVGSRVSVHECLGQFEHYYNTQRLYKSLN